MGHLLIISKEGMRKTVHNFGLNGTSLVKIHTGNHPNTGQQYNRSVFSVVIYCEFAMKVKTAVNIIYFWRHLKMKQF